MVEGAGEDESDFDWGKESEAVLVEIEPDNT